ncbi:MAG: methyltransferase domain-containing protein [Planctomycetes bacterium]|nr:methyltransferase domain-containing protein [Planctomycetota bacterium]
MRALLLLVACSLIGCAAHDGHGHAHRHDGATVHQHAWLRDAEAAARRFEDPARDAWQEPERVLDQLGLRPDARVLDIGAATGYFPVRIAPRVPEGVVYAADIEPALVNYLTLRARREGLANLVALACYPDDPCAPEPVDVVFTCDTYHHIDARVDYFTRLRGSLRSGGRLVVVDFRPGDLPVGPKDLHKLAAEVVVAELDRAGWRLVTREELTYQYVLVFEPR